ncbi:NADPH-dependent 1-acyldihydroxyacetone phosphate reductase [Paramyrothecium foliicola]|nr:NADPH-dependent 1-acyldihydroxyacetone phosphate reductase [Paramyrothecium foliicola]
MSNKRTALITGCSEGGAGHALALEFAAQGFRVFATARSLTSIASLQEKGIETLTLDVTQPHSISALKAEISKRTGGKLDVLFNNAGMMYEAPAIEADHEQVRKMFDTNVFGLFDMVEAFTPLLLSSVSGSKAPPTIINTASIVARVPYVFSAQYNASKAAVSSYSDTLRIELAPLGIKVVTLFMGVVSTNLISPEKALFAPKSLYIDAEPGLKERSRLHLQESMKPQDFARRVHQEVVNKKPALSQGEYVWQGTNAFVVWLLNAVGWRKIFDSTAEGGVGLTGSGGIVGLKLHRPLAWPKCSFHVLHESHRPVGVVSDQKTRFLSQSGPSGLLFSWAASGHVVYRHFGDDMTSQPSGNAACQGCDLRPASLADIEEQVHLHVNLAFHAAHSISRDLHPQLERMMLLWSTVESPRRTQDSGHSSSTGSSASPEQNGNPKQGPSRNGTKKLKDRIKTKKGPPGGIDSTPLPDTPQGYTLRFRFRYATNLPPGDISTLSSDPYLVATLNTSTPKRHKEDPDLSHRTRTLRRTTEPKWQDEWVVANVPPTGFTLKCRMYDEDYPDHNDKLGTVTVKVPEVSERWKGIPEPGEEFEARKRTIGRRALAAKWITTALHPGAHVTPRLCISIEVLGKSEPPYAQICTLAPTTWFKHFSPMIGRLAGTKVNEDANHDHQANGSQHEDRKPQKYDFQSNEMQLSGPIPPRLYHRYVEFKPVIGSMFLDKGLRGKVLNKVLHKQHDRIYSFNRSTENGTCEPCSKESALQFLKLVHFDEGGRIFTYALTLDGMLRFTETGKEFGIDLLSKHTMHADVATYIACSGEFFIRRLQHPNASEDPEPNEKTHPEDPIPGGPPDEDPPPNPSYYQLIIDNDSGTYRPDKAVLPDLKAFLEKNFPGLGIITMHWEDEELKELKEAQRNIKKKEGRVMNVVMNSSESSISSVESELDRRDGTNKRSKTEAAFAAVEDPSEIKNVVKTMLPHVGSGSRADDKL